MKINKYKLKDNITIAELISDDFSYSYDHRYLTKIIDLRDSINIWIKVSLPDFTLSIEVLDEDFGQYYIPFYRYLEGEKLVANPFLVSIITSYNLNMSKLVSLTEEIKC